MREDRIQSIVQGLRHHEKYTHGLKVRLAFFQPGELHLGESLLKL